MLCHGEEKMVEDIAIREKICDWKGRMEDNDC